MIRETAADRRGRKKECLSKHAAEIGESKGGGRDGFTAPMGKRRRCVRRLHRRAEALKGVLRNKSNGAGEGQEEGIAAACKVPSRQGLEGGQAR